MLAKDALQVFLKEAADFQNKKIQALNETPNKALQKQVIEAAATL